MTKLTITLRDEVAESAEAAARRLNATVDEIVERALATFASRIIEEPIAWPKLVESSVSVDESARAIDDGRR